MNVREISIEPFHLFRYLDERMCTFNLRDLTDYGRFEMVLRACAGRRITLRGFKTVIHVRE